MTFGERMNLLWQVMTGADKSIAARHERRITALESRVDALESFRRLAQDTER